MDTSTAISALIGGWFATIADAVEGGRLELACSEELLAELSDVLGRPRVAEHLPPNAAALFCQLYSQKAIFFEPSTNPHLCRDPRDDYLLALAAASDAEYLVTRDEDLLVLKRFGITEVVYPAQFLQILAESEGPPRK